MAANDPVKGGIAVRPLRDDDEKALYYRLAVDAFSAAPDPDESARRWREFVETSPDYDPVQVRGAFGDGHLLGGCIIYERTLLIGPAHLRTACIGAVVTHPHHRLRGVGRAMLEDALAFAQQRRHALVLLYGIAGFYHRFGFIDVLEETSHAIKLEDIAALPAGPLAVRAATLDDVPAMLQRYQAEFAPYPGAFARTAAFQAHQVQERLQINPPLVAAHPDGALAGYLVLPRPQAQARITEVVAPAWPAAAALLHAHAQRLQQNGDAPEQLHWQTPPGSSTFLALADHIHLESTTHHNPNADWMARPGHLPAFLAAILPLWQQRRQQDTASWQGGFTIDLGEAAFGLQTDGPHLRLRTPPASQAPVARLSPQAFMQLIFAFRPVSWLARQPGNHVPSHLVSVLQQLMPERPGWIPGSDRF